MVAVDGTGAAPHTGGDPSVPAAIGLTSLSPELQERVARVRQVQGRLLCRRSPLVALEASALAGCGAFVTGAASGWLVLRTMPTLVTSSDQRVVLTLVGGVFALTVTAGTAGYATARWRHARTIPSRGRAGAGGPGILIALLAAGGVLLTVQPWHFPPTNVVSVSAFRVGEYLALHQVAGGAVLFGKGNTPVAYLQTAGGSWVEATLPQSAVAAVVDEISVSPGMMYTRGDVAQGIGARQQRAIRGRTEWLWLAVGAAGASAALCTFAERRRWRNAPWLAPITDDTVRAMARLVPG